MHLFLMLLVTLFVIVAVVVSVVVIIAVVLCKGTLRSAHTCVSACSKWQTQTHVVGHESQQPQKPYYVFPISYSLHEPLPLALSTSTPFPSGIQHTHAGNVDFELFSMALITIFPIRLTVRHKFLSSAGISS